MTCLGVGKCMIIFNTHPQNSTAIYDMQLTVWPDRYYLQREGKDYLIYVATRHDNNCAFTFYILNELFTYFFATAAADNNTSLS